jgi:hypothetical protein
VGANGRTRPVRSDWSENLSVLRPLVSDWFGDVGLVCGMKRGILGIGHGVTARTQSRNLTAERGPQTKQRLGKHIRRSGLCLRGLVRHYE